MWMLYTSVWVVYVQSVYLKLKHSTTHGKGFLNFVEWWGVPGI